MLLVFVVLYVKEITTIRLPKLGFESFTGIGRKSHCGSLAMRETVHSVQAGIRVLYRYVMLESLQLIGRT